MFKAKFVYLVCNGLSDLNKVLHLIPDLTLVSCSSLLHVLVPYSIDLAKHT